MILGVYLLTGLIILIPFAIAGIIAGWIDSSSDGAIGAAIISLVIILLLMFFMTVTWFAAKGFLGI